MDREIPTRTTRLVSIEIALDFMAKGEFPTTLSIWESFE